MHVMRSGKFKMVCRNCVLIVIIAKAGRGGGHANVGYSFMLRSPNQPANQIRRS